MAFYDPITDGVKKLTPAELKKLADTKLTDLVRQEVPRARKRILELEQRYPSAKTRERAQRLIDEKKSVASMTGGVFGAFGLVGLPMDLTVMAWLQLTLLVDLATLYKVNLKGARATHELLDLYGYSTGVGPMQRSGPRVLGKVAEVLLKKGGLGTIGRAMPLVAAPVTAYLNNQHMQKVGEHAVRFYEGFDKAHAKTRAASSKSD
ncbi:EcsC family protein [Archangium primigenium]|uniref:EcsC family protein n=1 Tax=[Archangium] primigenium TaxID=2792470 RepID=UPI001957D31A|nr:EcsC family protein [Archangium primigenium]MBM7113117.1 EcsC family protein [Archangium primigenium]